MSQESQTQRPGEVTIDSNWIITIGLALLFAFIAFLLGWSIRNLLLDKVAYGALQGDRNGWLDTLTYPLGAVYSFVFAYSFPAKHLRVAFVFLGTKYVALIAVSYLHVAVGVQHLVAVAGSIATQIAYTIILVAIAQWFKNAVRWNPPSHPESATPNKRA